MYTLSAATCFVHEPEAEDFTAIVTDSMVRTFPADPERETIVITIVDRNNPSHVLDGHTFEGRAGLNLWYESNVGYAPDADSRNPIPIMELIDLVATLLLLFQKDVATASQ